MGTLYGNCFSSLNIVPVNRPLKLSPCRFWSNFGHSMGTKNVLVPIFHWWLFTGWIRIVPMLSLVYSLYLFIHSSLSCPIQDACVSDNGWLMPIPSNKTWEYVKEQYGSKRMWIGGCMLADVIRTKPVDWSLLGLTRPLNLTSDVARVINREGQFFPKGHSLKRGH